MEPTPAPTPSTAVPAGPGCEAVTAGWLAEPVSAVTSLAFVVAGVVVALAGRRAGGRGTGGRRTGGRRTDDRGRAAYGALVAGIGIGSWVQHGPDPAWSDVAHDAPLLATLAFVAADAAAGLTGRRRAWWWWAVPTVAALPVVAVAPRAGDLLQVAVAVVAVGLTVLRALAHPAVRRRTTAAVVLLAVGAALGTLSRAGGPLCDPASPWQGHGAWHVLAATALAVLAPTLGRPGARPEALGHPGR